MATKVSKASASTNGATNNGVEHQIMKITPEIAEEMLTHNTHNRKIHNRDVISWTREMAEGRWEFDGDPIRFDQEGTLLDGQHRLSAVVASGTTQTFLVIRGLPTETQVNMDTGRKRTAANALELLGSHDGYTAALAAAARIGVKAERIGLNADGFGGEPVTNREVVNFCAAHPELLDAVKFVRPLYREADVPSFGVAAYAFWRMWLLDPEAAELFWISAAEKVGLGAGNPILTLTKRFAEARRTREHITHQKQLSLIFRAWNAYRKGEGMQKIYIRTRAGDIPAPEPI